MSANPVSCSPGEETLCRPPGTAIPHAGVPQQPPHNTGMTDVFTLLSYLPPPLSPSILRDAYRNWFRKHQKPPDFI